MHVCFKGYEGSKKKISNWRFEKVKVFSYDHPGLARIFRTLAHDKNGANRELVGAKGLTWWKNFEILCNIAPLQIII